MHEYVDQDPDSRLTFFTYTAVGGIMLIFCSYSIYVRVYLVAEGFCTPLFNKPTQLALPLYIRKYKLVITVKK
jgi:hypothetical protein